MGSNTHLKCQGNDGRINGSSSSSSASDAGGDITEGTGEGVGTDGGSGAERCFKLSMQTTQKRCPHVNTRCSSSFSKQIGHSFSTYAGAATDANARHVGHLIRPAMSSLKIALQRQMS